MTEVDARDSYAGGQGEHEGCDLGIESSRRGGRRKRGGRVA